MIFDSRFKFVSAEASFLVSFAGFVFIQENGVDKTCLGVNTPGLRSSWNEDIVTTAASRLNFIEFKFELNEFRSARWERAFQHC